MTTLLLLYTLFLVLSGEVFALQCHTCEDVARHTGQSSLMCEDSYIKNHTKELLQGCSTPPSGYTARCTKFGGQAEEVEQTGSSIIMDGVSRGCVNFKENGLPQSKCYHGDEASPWLSSLVPGTEGASVYGLICFCEESGCNSVGFTQPCIWPLLLMLFALCAIVQVTSQ